VKQLSGLMIAFLPARCPGPPASCARCVARRTRASPAKGSAAAHVEAPDPGCRVSMWLAWLAAPGSPEAAARGRFRDPGAPPAQLRCGDHAMPWDSIRPGQSRPETEGFPDGRARISNVPCTQAPSGRLASVNLSGNQRPGRTWRPRLLGRSRAWRDVLLPSTAGPGPTGPGVPGRPGAGGRTVDSTALVITLLIVLLVVIDRVVRR
jgi:hypothetical protein